MPRRVGLAADGALSVVSLKREGEARSRVVVDVKADGNVDVFAEGPDAGWSLPLPERLADAPPGLRRFAFELDGAPPGADTHNIPLTLTVVSTTQAIEVGAHLD